MAQEWNMRYILVDKQGNFGSIAGLPAAAMRYTEARMSQFAGLLLEDLKLDTVDYVPTYDERSTEPTVLPSEVAESSSERCQWNRGRYGHEHPAAQPDRSMRRAVAVIDNPDISIDELLEIVPGPDFPTGGIIMGRAGIRRAYHTGRGTITLRARASIEEMGKGRYQIVVHEVPYQQARDRVEERIGELINEDRIKGIRAHATKAISKNRSAWFTNSTSNPIRKSC